MEEHVYSIEYMDGKLIFDMPYDDWEPVTLVDYTGDTELFIIPSIIQYAGKSFDVEPQIPDCGFSSCSKIKYIVVQVPEYNDKPFRFGSCVFENCNNLAAIITISKSPEKIDVLFDEYSFFRDVKTIHIVAGEHWEAHSTFDVYIPDYWDANYAHCVAHHALLEQQCEFCARISNKLVDVVRTWFNNGNIDKLMLSMRRFGGSESTIILTNEYCHNVIQGTPIQLWTEAVFKPFEVELLDLYP